MESLTGSLSVFNGSSKILNNTFYNQNRGFHKQPTTDYFFYFVAAVAVFGVTGNVLTAVLLLRNTIKSISILLLCLATSDTLFIIFMTIHACYALFAGNLASWGIIPLQPLIGTSSGLAAIIGFERSLAVLLPFWYKQVWTKKKTVISVIPIIVLNCGVAIIQRIELLIPFKTHIRLAEQLVTRYVPGICILFTNILITTAMIKYSRFRKESLSSTVKKEMKITRSMFVVILTFFICMLPGSILLLMTGTANISALDLAPLMLTSQFLEVINASCNFIIYVITSKFYRREYKRLLTCQRNEH